MGAVKGKENEQERRGKLRNEDIDKERTRLNYDLVDSDKNLYQRVKERVDFAKETGSRVQKNSVVMYSNVLTVPQEQAEQWGDKKTKKYFEACKDYFSKEFGHENVVSAKVHLDETAPHMHLHFVPFNKENGRLQARKAMDKTKINQIHNELPSYLREQGFEVERGTGKTKNIEDVHEYKEVQHKIKEKEKELESLSEVVPKEKEDVSFLEREVQKVKTGFMKSEEQKTGNYVVSAEQLENMNEKAHAATAIISDYERMKRDYDRMIERDIYKENGRLTGKVLDLQREIRTEHKPKINELESFIKKSEDNTIHEEINDYKLKIDDLNKLNQRLDKQVNLLLENNEGLSNELESMKSFVKNNSVVFEEFAKEYASEIEEEHQEEDQEEQEEQEQENTVEIDIKKEREKEQDDELTL